MKSLILESTESTPEIHFNIENHIFDMTGVSMPENASGFYQQIIDWLDVYKENIANNKTGTDGISIKLNFKLTYCNSASAKYLLIIMERLKKLKDSGVDNIEINWYYDAGDELMLNDGQDLSDTINMPFNYHAI
jgi:hypothetical protein